MTYIQFCSLAVLVRPRVGHNDLYT